MVWAREAAIEEILQARHTGKSIGGLEERRAQAKKKKSMDCRRNVFAQVQLAAFFGKSLGEPRAAMHLSRRYRYHQQANYSEV